MTRGIKISAILLLGTVVLADLLAEPHPHFGIDGSLGFNAWYALIACMFFAGLAWVLKKIVRREEEADD